MRAVPGPEESEGHCSGQASGAASMARRRYREFRRAPAPPPAASPYPGLGPPGETALCAAGADAYPLSQTPRISRRFPPAGPAFRPARERRETLADRISHAAPHCTPVRLEEE